MRPAERLIFPYFEGVKTQNETLLQPGSINKQARILNFDYDSLTLIS